MCRAGAYERRPTIVNVASFFLFFMLPPLERILYSDPIHKVQAIYTELFTHTLSVSVSLSSKD